MDIPTGQLCSEIYRKENESIATKQFLWGRYSYDILEQDYDQYNQLALKMKYSKYGYIKNCY